MNLRWIQGFGAGRAARSHRKRSNCTVSEANALVRRHRAAAWRAPRRAGDEAGEDRLLEGAQAAQRVPVQHARRRDGIAGLGERLPEIGPGEMARAH